MVQKFYPYYFIFFLFPVVGFKGGRALGVAKGHPTPLEPPGPGQTLREALPVRRAGLSEAPDQEKLGSRAGEHGPASVLA